VVVVTGVVRSVVEEVVVVGGSVEDDSSRTVAFVSGDSEADGSTGIDGSSSEGFGLGLETSDSLAFGSTEVSCGCSLWSVGSSATVEPSFAFCWLFCGVVLRSKGSVGAIVGETLLVWIGP